MVATNLIGQSVQMKESGSYGAIVAVSISSVGFFQILVAVNNDLVQCGPSAVRLA